MANKEKLRKNLDYANTIKELKRTTNRNSNIRAIFDRMPYDMPDHRYDGMEESGEEYGVE